MTTDIDAPEEALFPTGGEITSTREKSGKEITEEMGIHKQWYLDSKDITAEEIPAFINRLINDYDHDYGTICHAMAAGAIAAMRAINNSDQGGITGFQAGCIMWEFIKNWMHFDGPLTLVQFENMLYPQYHDKFINAISQHTWEYLQEKAKAKLAEIPDAHENVKAHWQSIVDGVVPFGWSVDTNED